jgi:hypothetical protein
MKCQIGNCRNECNRIITKQRCIIHGTSMSKTITAFICDKHSKEEIEQYSNHILENEYKRQKINLNPFLEVSKLTTK